MNNKHKHDENCNCNHDGDFDDNIVITLDDDSELDCEVIGVFEVDKNEYIALIPAGEEEANVLIYKYTEEGDEILLDIIEDDDEFDAVSEAFYQLIDEDEYEIRFEEDDEESTTS